MAPFLVAFLDRGSAASSPGDLQPSHAAVASSSVPVVAAASAAATQKTVSRFSFLKYVLH